MERRACSPSSPRSGRSWTTPWRSPASAAWRGSRATWSRRHKQKGEPAGSPFSSIFDPLRRVGAESSTLAEVADVHLVARERVLVLDVLQARLGGAADAACLDEQDAAGLHLLRGVVVVHDRV